MLSKEEIIHCLDHLGRFLTEQLTQEDSTWVDQITRAAYLQNGWFEKREVIYSLEYWSKALNSEDLSQWVFDVAFPDSPKKVGLILAGNIPMVGFHDVISTILSGNIAMIKCSSSDSIVIPELLNQLSILNPEIAGSFEFVDRLKGFDAAIATGSNNSTRYFESYFSHVPNIIRGNRTSIAVLNGKESEDELHGLMKDCFTYFGLGCRNVTKLYLPDNYELNEIFKASIPFAYLAENNKYVNNYIYHKALMMMEKKAVLENELILMIENPSLFSPVSVLNYEYYKNEEDLNLKIEQNLDQIQCVVGGNNRLLGTAQSPKLNDYADGVNTLSFLSKLGGLKLSN